MPTRHKPDRDNAANFDEHAAVVSGAEHEAAGVKAVMVSLDRGLKQMGPVRTVAALSRLNQRHGFDCPGCAWPEEPGGRKLAEFCENGAKAVAEEATKRRVTPDFFARHSVAELADQPEYWLSQQGRITQPMVLADGDTHYRPIEWDDAYRLIAEHLNGLASPDEACFYTSGRTSNEAAFLYQLLVRSFGTNNLPDCSNMCHESSGTALTDSIGIGKGSVTVEDVVDADCILIAGQNPGTNHPRMLSILEKAKARGAKIIAVNPLPEAGLMRFKDPQKVHGVVGHGVPIADEFVQIRLGGDMALFAGLGRLLLEAEDRNPGSVLDRDFIARHCAGFDEYEKRTRAVDLDTVTEATGIDREQLERVARMLIASDRTVFCWAMGLTQHRHAVATIGEATNLLLMRGMIGKPGAGVCPVRGHSNVQGDRTMGIWEKMPEEFLAALDTRFGITSPRKHGHDTVDAIRAMRDGDAKVFIGMGGNFASATPDTEVTEAALRSCALTVQISTKLNRSHVVHGRTALILPTLGRTDRDIQAGGKQLVSVEDSMSMVHLSRGSLTPPSAHLRSEVAIVCELARTPFSGQHHPVPWAPFTGNYDLHPRRHRRRRARLHRLQHPGAAARRIPAAASAAGLPRVPHHHGQGQLRGVPTGVGAGAAGPVGAADAAQPRPVQHHHLRARRPLPRREGWPSGGVRQSRRHRFTRPRGRDAGGPDLRVHRCGRQSRGATRQGLPRRAVLDARRQRGVVLPGDQPAGPAGPHGHQVEHAGLQGGRRPTRARRWVGSPHGGPPAT